MGKFWWENIGDEKYHARRVKESEKKHNAQKRWIGVDLDGTLAVAGPYYPYPDEIGEPVEDMIIFVKNAISAGRTVKVFTARAAWKESVPHVKAWLKKHGLGTLEITNVKDMYCDLIIDDKALQVMKNAGHILQFTPARML